VRLQNGETLRGLAKNESTFDLQLLGVDGKLHLLMKFQIASITLEKSLMPKVNATPEERRDLLAYLSRLTVDPRIGVIPAAEMSSGTFFYVLPAMARHFVSFTPTISSQRQSVPSPIAQG
jgi:hypothetical protein